MTAATDIHPKPQTALAYSSAPARGSNFVALQALYLLSLRQNLHGKRWIVITLLFLLPTVIVILLRAMVPNIPPIELEFRFVFILIPQTLLPLLALIYASGVIQDEQEEQTLTYLLIRPIPKWALYIVKLLATLTTTIALTAIFTAILYFVIYVGAPKQTESIALRYFQAIAIQSLAVITYCALFGFISLYTKRSLILGILYIAIFEGVLANMPMSIRLITVLYYTRLIAYRSMTFPTTIPGLPNHHHDLAAQVWQLDVKHDPKLLEHPQIAACIATLLFASLALTLLAAFLCSRREFYVKTPEKS